MIKLEALIEWYSTLTPATIPRLREIYHEQARFRDPFNDVKGHAAIGAIFRHMFVTTEQPRFRIREIQQEAGIAWVSWVFDFHLYTKAASIEGVTRLEFASDGRVLDHRDYWDALDLFVEVPLLGRIVRFLRNRLRSRDPCKE
ncbi:MAG: nuclear transport factor 2 family protein [Chromatiales bacterium]|jgi:hypothetical protein